MSMPAGRVDPSGRRTFLKTQPADGVAVGVAWSRLRWLNNAYAAGGGGGGGGAGGTYWTTRGSILATLQSQETQLEADVQQAASGRAAITVAAGEVGNVGREVSR